jgi:alcohol dehydrogenase class IV
MTEAPLATITLPRLIMIGAGASGEVANAMAKIGVSRPLIVADPYMRESGKLERITAVLDEAGISHETFTDTVPDPPTEVVATGAGILKEGDFDSMIALGGGSPMDTAKAMGVLATHGGHMRDYKVPYQADSSAYPLIAIPTTAGTGAEVTKFVVVTDTETDDSPPIPESTPLPMRSRAMSAGSATRAPIRWRCRA